MMGSDSIDGVGKFAKENKQSYSYKNLVQVIPLAMIDDLILITSCGMKSMEMIISIN